MKIIPWLAVVVIVAFGSSLCIRAQDISKTGSLDLATEYELSKSKDDTIRSNAYREIAKQAARLYLLGQSDRARTHATYVWLSSAPNDARVQAWNTLYLIENKPVKGMNGHPVTIRVPGSRDHQRFNQWLQSQTVEKHAWIKSLHIRYELVEVDSDVAGENGFITFALENESNENDLTDLLKGLGGTYSTANWTVLKYEPLD